MTKIFEALERASQEKAPIEKRSVNVIPQRFSLKPADADIEKRMIGLYQNICALVPSQSGRTIQFISSHDREGASVLLREFTKVVAWSLNKQVLLLDGSLGNNQINYFSAKPKFSWAEAIQDHLPIEDLIYQVGKTNLYISQVSTRAISVCPTLDSTEADENLKKLQMQFDLIVIDAPPANVSNDCLAVSRKLDGLILVVEAEYTRWRTAQQLKAVIERQGGRILGVLLNKRCHYIPQYIYDRI